MADWSADWSGQLLTCAAFGALHGGKSLGTCGGLAINGNFEICPLDMETVSRIYVYFESRRRLSAYQ